MPKKLLFTCSLLMILIAGWFALSKQANAQIAREAVDKIAAAWPSDTALALAGQVKLSFKLDQFGNAYDITYIKGCAAPTFMMAAVHSILFSMPFDRAAANRSFVLTLQADTPNKIRFELSNAKPVEPIPDAKLLSDMPCRPEKKGLGADFWMYQKLLYLCAKASKFPDFAIVQVVLDRTLKAFSLQPASAHDWLCIARCNPPNLEIKQNLGEYDVKNCNSFVGAVFAAWKLQKSNEILWELQESYRYKLALEVLQVKRDEPLYLGIAAELTDDYTIASKYYISSGTAFGKALNTRFSDNQIFAPARGRAFVDAAKDWRYVSNWLPLDSEVLAVVPKPSGEGVGKNPEGVTLFDVINSICGVRRIAKTSLLCAVHGGRNFLPPRALGRGMQSSAAILVFDREPVAQLPEMAIYHDWEKVTFTKEIMDGYDVAVRQSRIHFGCTDLQFEVWPASNIKIVASNRNYLRQLLRRFRARATSSAFPKYLPEWALVNTNADCFALRHYDKSCAAFDRSVPQVAMPACGPDGARIFANSFVGFAFDCTKNDSFRFSFLGSAPKEIKLIEMTWRRDDRAKYDKFLVSLQSDGKTATLTGKFEKSNSRAFNLGLLHYLGYLIAM